MAESAAERDVRKSGILRKWKGLQRRLCVLRAGGERAGSPPRLELYPAERGRGWLGAGPRRALPPPRRALPLGAGTSVNKRADARGRFLLCVFTPSESVCLAAAGAQEQEEWYRALREVLQGKPQVENGESGYNTVPGPPYKEVWQVNLRPRGLGQSRNMSGIYRLCLTDKTVSLVKPSVEAGEAVALQLMNIRRCGHSENFFFVEVGRSAVTGPGEFWMQVDDSVVAQHMHETMLEAMKALSEEFRLRGKSQPSSSNPISVPSRHHHPPPSQVGFPARRSGATSPAQRYGLPRPRSTGDPPASRPASADEAPSSPSPGLPPPRQGLPRAHPAQARSTPDPACRRSPSAAGLSSGGSPCHRAFSFSSSSSSSSPPPSLSPSSSSSDEGEEYGSSAGSCGRFPLPRPSGGPQPDYISMGAPPRGLPGRGEESEERGPGRLGKGAPRGGKAEARPPSTPDPAGKGRRPASADSGYVAMLPGAMAGPASGDDYMAMTPQAPQQTESPQARGAGGSYMLMSPSGSCSPLGSARSLAGSSDYMNMSPASRSASSTPPASRDPGLCRREEAQPADPRSHCYHSLPRSYKQPASIPPSSQVLPHTTSSSSSSDSLGETQSGLPPQTGSPATQTPSRPGRGGGLSRQAAGLHLDVARANTLPRRRENPPPSPGEPHSPGEYVSIEFRREPRSPRPPARPAPEYANLDFAPAGRPQPGARSPLPAGAAETAPRPGPGPASPQGARDPGQGLSGDPRPGARVVRAGSQGRRRHCSETFLTPPSDPAAPLAHRAGRRGSATLEGGMLKGENGSGGERGAVEVLGTGMSRHMCAGFENGLNYIDLDLSADSSCVDTSAPQSRLYAALNTYASIDFHKSQELRSHNSHKEACDSGRPNHAQSPHGTVRLALGRG
ncbi:insulin receptor substrate 1-like [Mustelus asterias]